MPTRNLQSKRFKQLEQRKEQLCRVVAEQQRQNEDLLFRHNLLQAWCECLCLIQMSRLSLNGSQLDSSAHVTHELERLLEAEGGLLNELSTNPASSSTTAAVLDVGVDTIAPAGDPMAFFKQHISRTPLQNAEDMTFQEMAQLFREADVQLSVQLHILQNPAPDQYAEAHARVLEATDKVVHVAMSLVMVGREDLVERANFLNLETLQPDIDGATKQAALTSTLIDRVGITPQQQRVIATGVGMYMKLLESVVQERQQLQSQFATAMQAHSGSSSSSGGGGSHDGSSQESLQDRQQLEAQRKHVARLQLLIRKEMMLRMAGMTWFIGCLSAQQFAKACVLCWPYPLRASLLALEIMKRAEAEQSANLDLERPAGATSIAGG